MEKYRQYYKDQFEDCYEEKQCPFYLRYERQNPDDQASYYKLIEFNSTHTHTLGFHEIRFKDFNGYLGKCVPSHAVAKYEDFRAYKDDNELKQENQLLKPKKRRRKREG